MSDHNKKVEPVRFDPVSNASPAPGEPAQNSQPKAAEASGSSAEAPAKWVLPALGALIVVAVLVVFWLPSVVETKAPVAGSAGDGITSAGAAGTERPAAKGAARAPVDSSPYQDAQTARERKAAQDVLAELLEVQFALEEMAVEQWAADDFAAAQELAATADTQYREQMFIDAAETYRAGLNAMLAIQDSAEAVFRKSLDAAIAALRSDQAQAALDAVGTAILIKPDDPEALVVLARAESLEPLLELLKTANTLSAAGDLEAAIATLKDAVAMDPEHAGARAQLAATQRRLAKQNFNRAMSEGYSHLDAQEFDSAVRAFKAAQAILPAAGEPATALAETRIARTQAQIEAWRRRAADAEQREDWSRAVSAYKEILDIDRSVVVARSGLLRSKSRAQIDQRIKKALASTDRLSSDAIYKDTQALYQQALALESKGPLLREQLAALSTLLEQAAIPQPVLLQSDEATDVTVLKVAKLGEFRRQQLSLKPGVYTAVGVRKGFRDVRKQFRVKPDGDQATVVEVICTERI